MSRIVSKQKGAHTYVFRFEPENEDALLNLLADADYCDRVGLDDSDVEELQQQIASGQSYPPSLTAPQSAPTTSTPAIGAFVAVPFYGPCQQPPVSMQALYAMAWQAAQAAHQPVQPQAKPGYLPPSDRFTRW